MEVEMEDKKKYSEEEIIAILTGKLTKGFSMKSICEELNINSYELFSYITKIKESGVNITIFILNFFRHE